MLNINNELFVDIKNFLNHPWSVTPENMVKHADEINQAANAVTKLRDTGWIPEIRNESFDRVSPIIYFQEQPTAV